MPREVTLKVKGIKMGKCLFKFDVKINGQKLGTLEVKETGLSWDTRSAQKATLDKSWEDFDKLMRKLNA